MSVEDARQERAGDAEPLGGVRDRPAFGFDGARDEPAWVGGVLHAGHSRIAGLRPLRPGGEIDMTEYALFFESGGPVFGEGYIASVRVHGRALATYDEEDAWSLLKRAYHGTYHKMSPRHLHRYVTELNGRYNDRQLRTIERMGHIARGMVGKRLRYRELVA